MKSTNNQRTGNVSNWCSAILLRHRSLTFPTRLFLLCVFFISTKLSAASPEWVFRTTTGETLTTPTWSLEEGDYKLGEKKISTTQVYSVEQTQTPRPQWPTSGVIVTLAGDRLAGELVSGDGSKITWKANFGKVAVELNFPMSALAFVQLQSSDMRTDPEPNKGRDRIRLSGGEDLTGAIGTITLKEGITLDEMGKKKQIALNKVQALIFNSDLARPRLPRNAYYRITTRNGNRLLTTKFSSDGKDIQIENLFREKVTLPQNEILAIDEINGKAIDLGTLKPSEFRYTPFDDETFAFKINQNVLGQPLTLKKSGHTEGYDSGLGLHSGMNLKYSLDGKFKKLEGKIGLDAIAGVRGEVVLTIKLDGKAIEGWTDRKLTIKEETLNFEIGIDGAKELQIEIKRGGLGPVQGVVNVVNARLVP